MPKVIFVNEQVTVDARAGETLLQIAARSQINLFRGLWQEFRCGRVTGWCGRCKVWATPLSAGALSERTLSERLPLRPNGTVPRRGTMRLACKAQVLGDVEVQTRAGFEILPSLRWEPDPRPWRWKDRWEQRSSRDGAEGEKAKKKVVKEEPAAEATATAFTDASKPAPAGGPDSAAKVETDKK